MERFQNRSAHKFDRLEAVKTLKMCINKVLYNKEKMAISNEEKDAQRHKLKSKE